MNVKKLGTGLFVGLFIFSITLLELSAQSVMPVKVETLEDLKKLQDGVKAVVKVVRPATVALTSTRSGASGSGVIVNRGGLILSAAHVVSGDKEMSVIFPDGKAFKAKVLGSNRTKDVAMLQLVKRGDWPFVEIGDSDNLKIGAHLVAMGHAGGYDTRRPAPVRFGRLLSKNKRGFITTDSVLIGGDSGGPLFDMSGKLVGINSSIGDSWQTNNHAGISALVKDWDRLLKGDTWGRLNRNPMTDPDSPVMGFIFEETQGNQGVIVMGVLGNSPADKAGMKKGDVVVGIDQRKIKNGKDLLVTLSRYNPKDEVVVSIRRRGEVKKMKVVLSKRGDLFKR